jgi:hypothetical protein
VETFFAYGFVMLLNENVPDIHRLSSSATCCQCVVSSHLQVCLAMSTTEPSLRPGHSQQRHIPAEYRLKPTVKSFPVPPFPILTGVWPVPTTLVWLGACVG